MIVRTHHWSDQSFLDCNRDTDVGVLVVTNELLLKRRVDFWVLDQRCCRYFNDHVVDTDLKLRVEGVDAATHLGRAVHFNLGREKEVRHWSKRRDQSLGDRLSNLTRGLVAIT